MTYVLRLPFEAPPATMNDVRRGKGGRSHWSTQQADKATVEDAVIVVARAAKVPLIERCAIRLVWLLPTEPRVDNDALAVMLKACKDGLVKAKVLRDDRCQIVVEDRLRIVTGVGREFAPAMLLEIEVLPALEVAEPCPEDWLAVARMGAGARATPRPVRPPVRRPATLRR